MKMPSPEMSQISRTLNRLGLSANYKGFRQLAWAVMLVQKEPERLLMVTKQVYPDVAKRCRVTQQAVERNLRTAVKVIWKENTSLLREVLGESRWERPCNARFIALLTAWLAEEGHAAAAGKEAQPPL